MLSVYLLSKWTNDWILLIIINVDMSMGLEQIEELGKVWGLCGPGGLSFLTVSLVRPTPLISVGVQNWLMWKEFTLPKLGKAQNWVSELEISRQDCISCASFQRLRDSRGPSAHTLCWPQSARHEPWATSKGRCFYCGIFWVCSLKACPEPSS